MSLYLFIFSVFFSTISVVLVLDSTLFLVNSKYFVLKIPYFNYYIIINLQYFYYKLILIYQILTMQIPVKSPAVTLTYLGMNAVQ